MTIEIKAVVLNALQVGAQALATLLLLWFFEDAGPISAWGWAHYVCAILFGLYYIKFMLTLKRRG